MTVAGVVLCGGKSRRMGTDKLSIRLGEKTWLTHACDTLRQAGADEIICAGRAEAAGGIADSISSCGPVGGICSALRYLGTSAATILVVPVDMPWLSPQDLRRLADEAAKLNEPVCYAQSPLPFAARVASIGSCMVSDLETRLALGENISVRSFLRNLDVRQIEPDDTTHLRNFNTPEDLRQLGSY